MNRLLVEYAADDLPHVMQIRDDMKWLIDIAFNLARDLDRAKKQSA